MDIIIKNSKPSGSTRTKHDEQLRKEGWGSSFVNEEAADKAAFIERKLKEKYGADHSFVRGENIEGVK